MITPVIFNVNQGIQELLNMLRHLIGEDIDLQWQPDSIDCFVHIDPAQFDQILVNLCINARDAIRDIGTIAISTQLVAVSEQNTESLPGFIPNKFVKLTIHDNGCGMDKATLENVFEPFYTTKEAPQGTGLGLASVYGTVKQNNGLVDVQSEPGKGTVFEVYLPAHVGPKTGDVVATDTAIPEGQGETILVVEDELAILEMVETILKVNGYHVISAASATEALESITDRSQRISLLITDVIMPDMNGRDLAAHLMAKHPEMSCLFMSGYTADIIGGMEDGVEGINFIQKPFTMDTLSEKIHSILDDSEA